MRPISILSLAFAFSTAVAQQPTDPNEQLIWDAYVTLQPATPYELSISGTETINGTAHPFTSNLYWETGTDPRDNLPSQAKVEEDDYDGSNNLLRRYVGDGQTLWFYDLVNRRYNGATYTWFGKPIASYVGSDAPRLLAQLYGEVRGPAAYMVRLLREVDPGLATFTSRYNSWAPGYTTSQVIAGNPPVTDPLVPTRIYTATGTIIWVLYGPTNTNPTRSVAFQLNETSTAPATYNLLSVDFADSAPGRFQNWTITVTDPVTPTAGIFTPYPAAVTRGWQLMPAPNPAS